MTNQHSGSSPTIPAETSSSLARIHARAWGVATGALFGGGLWLATIVLVLKNGPNLGEHLSLLSVFMPGYSVSVAGSFVGFVYAFVVGYALGRVIGTVYNATLRTY